MPKTDKERLQDNNTAILRIKGKAQNLPDQGMSPQDVEEAEELIADLFGEEEEE